MNSIAPQTPVIIGVAQKTVHRGQQPGPEPLAAWEEVARSAARDSGVSDDALAQIDALYITDCMTWRYDDPVARLAERLGADPKVRLLGPPSGTSPQSLANNAFDAIRQRQASLALVCGGEALATMRHYHKQGTIPPWSHAHADGPGHWFDIDKHQHPGEAAIGLTEGIGAVYGFAMRDIARRAHLGIAPDVYRQQLGQTLCAMTSVAARNPHAWFGEQRSTDFLVTPRPDNRLIAYPYTKHMVAIMDVDICAGLLIASEEWADANGVPREQRVYPWTSCYAEDPVYIAVRPELWKSPAMEAASRAVLHSAGLTMNDIDHVDLYSCFAAAVNFGRDALGVPDRPGEAVTVTGGLPYAGGPGSSFVLTSIGRMAGMLRANPGTKGLVSGLGMMMSNHVYSIYSTTPPGPDVRQPDQPAVQAALDAIPQFQIDDDYVGPAKIATYTVMYDREGVPSHGAAICDLPTGDRSYARIVDPELLLEAERTELVGRRVEIAPGLAVGTIVAFAPVDYSAVASLPSIFGIPSG